MPPSQTTSLCVTKHRKRSEHEVLSFLQERSKSNQDAGISEGENTKSMTMTLDEDSNSEGWTIEDLSPQPWVSDPEDDDFAPVSLPANEFADGFISTDVLNSCNTSHESMKRDAVQVSPYLQKLMNRYPKHVPASLPPRLRAKRKRPVCLFINYMGTRRIKPVLATQLARTKVEGRLKTPRRPCESITLVSPVPKKRKQLETDQLGENNHAGFESVVLQS